MKIKVLLQKQAQIFLCLLVVFAMTLFSPPSPVPLGKKIKKKMIQLYQLKLLLVSIIVTATDFLLYCGSLSSTSYNLNEFGQVQLHGAQLTHIIEKIMQLCVSSFIIELKLRKTPVSSQLQYEAEYLAVILHCFVLYCQKAIFRPALQIHSCCLYLV